MRGIVLCGLAGCSFSATAGGSSVPDAAETGADASMPATACAVKPRGAPVVAGMVGPGGGSTRPDVTCAEGEFPIGFDFRHYDPIVATHVRCGRIARAADGTITTTPTTRVGDPGLHGTCVILQPIATIPEQTCPAGHVLVGITVNNIGSSYNSFAMHCQPLTAAMQITGALMTVAFPGTGTAMTALQSASCGPGMAAVAFGLKSGCDQELLVLECSNVICE